ncbi:MAG: hypothetical protein ACRC1P_02900 [Cellulosilyticaceae bacterium]
MSSEIETPVIFTKKMKKEYTILAPTMLPIHFGLIKGIMKRYGYKMEFCEGETSEIIEEGLKCVHNDICYPAMLVIGQFIAALKSGKYDVNKTALMITQTGGGCRASNYIYLLRKALKNSGLEQVPVISLNLSGIEKHPGFKLKTGLLIKAVFALYYGDLLMWIYNQCLPYEQYPGDSKKVLEKWMSTLGNMGASPKFFLKKKYYREILMDFEAIPKQNIQKIKVGIVGEIYMKYAPLGNNQLEQFLHQEDAEVVMSGVADFILYCFDNKRVDKELYGMRGIGTVLSQLGYKYMVKQQKKLIKSIKENSHFRPPTEFETTKEMVEGYIGLGVKMGEGWLLTAEMLELIHSGVNNIVCTQPFGCLPNHIVAKGMIRKIKEHFSDANIIPIDYDPSATRVNQENRIKLMLANAKWQVRK